MSLTTWSAMAGGQENALSISTEPDVRPETSNRVVGGTLKMLGNHKVFEEQTMRCNEKDLAPNTTSMMGTVQNNAGMSTANITPESTVEIPGFGRTSVKVAERLGYIERAGDGTYKETNQEDFQVSPEDIPTDPAPDVFGPRTEQAYSDMIAPVPQDTYDSLLGAAAAQIGSQDGADMDSIAASLAPRLATSMGIEPEKATAMIQMGAAVWQDQADRLVKSMGADPSEFYEWAKANRRNDLQQAIVQQLYARNTKGYKALVDDFYHSTTPKHADLERQGYEVKKGPDGETLVMSEHGWVSASSIRKMHRPK